MAGWIGALGKGIKYLGNGLKKGAIAAGKGIKSAGRGAFNYLMNKDWSSRNQSDIDELNQDVNNPDLVNSSSETSSKESQSNSSKNRELEIKLAESKAEVKADSIAVNSISSIVKESENKNKISEKLSDKYGIELKPNKVLVKSTESTPSKVKSENTDTKLNLNIFNNSKNIKQLEAIENILKAQLEAQTINNDLLQSGNKIELVKSESQEEKTKLVKSELKKLNDNLNSANNIEFNKDNKPQRGSTDLSAVPIDLTNGTSSMAQTESQHESQPEETETKSKGILGTIASLLPISNPFSKKATKVAGTIASKSIPKVANKPGFLGNLWNSTKSVTSKAYNKVATVVKNKLIASVNQVVKNVSKLLGPKIGPKIAQVITKLGTSIAKFAGTAAKSAGKLAGKAIPGVGLILGIGDAIYRGFKKGDWLGALLSTIAGIASTFPGLGGAAAIAIESINLIRDLKNDKDEVAELIKEAKDNGWMTDDPNNPYQLLMKKYGDNPNETQKKQLASELRKLNDLMKRKSKLTKSEFNQELKKQTEEIRNSLNTDNTSAISLGNSQATQITTQNLDNEFNQSTDWNTPTLPKDQISVQPDVDWDSSLPNTIAKGDTNSIVSEARKFEGKIPYSQNGPRNPYLGSADCSSFVSHIYQKTTGINPGFNTDIQLNSDKGTIVDQGSVNSDGTGGGEGPDLSKLQPGDLLFERRKSLKNAGRKFKVGHVSMYVGDGKVLSQGGHKGKPGPYEVDITTPNYAKNYIAAKRYVTGGLSSNVVTQPNEDVKSEQVKGTEADTTTVVESNKDKPIVVNAPVTKTYNKTTNNYIRTNRALNAELN